MNKYFVLIIFGILNFAALGLGGLFMGNGPESPWYQELDKAPWTPPGWVFGVAWTTIMVCFSIFMARLWIVSEKAKSVAFLFGIQWFLNVLWNPVFFKFHMTLIGLVIITILTGLVFKFLFGYRSVLKGHALWVLPYAVWLLIATSLNAYIYFNN